MDELIKSFRYFITRDLVYIVGGASVIASFLYKFDRLPSDKTHSVMLFLAAAMSYMLGHAIQDLSSMLPFITTQAQVYLQRDKDGKKKDIGKLVKYLYKKFTHTEWEVAKKSDYDSYLNNFRENAEKDKNKIKWAEYQRLLTLQMLGTTMAPCAFLSGTIILTKWFTSHASFDVTLGVSAIILSCGLLCLGWVKGAQGVRFVMDIGPDLSEQVKPQATGEK